MSKWIEIPAPFWAERMSYREDRPGWVQACITLTVQAAGSDRAWKPSRRWAATWVAGCTTLRTDTTSAVGATVQHDVIDISHEAPGGHLSFLIWLARE